MDAPKKKVVIKVKPHVVSVGGKKPSNGGKGVENPIEPVNLKRGFLSRCVSVIKEDMQVNILRTKAIVKDPEPGWEEYMRFLELTKK
jgi:hypothetical protein